MLGKLRECAVIELQEAHRCGQPALFQAIIVTLHTAAVSAVVRMAGRKVKVE